MMQVAAVDELRVGIFRGRGGAVSNPVPSGAVVNPDFAGEVWFQGVACLVGTGICFLVPFDSHVRRDFAEECGGCVTRTS